MGNLMTFGSSSFTISIKKVLVFCHIVIVVVVFDIVAFIGIFRKEPGIKNIVLDAVMFYFRAFYHVLHILQRSWNAKQFFFIFAPKWVVIKQNNPDYYSYL